MKVTKHYENDHVMLYVEDGEHKFVDKPRRKPKMTIVYGGGCCEER